MAGLAGADQVASASDLEISHGYSKARTQFGGFPDSLQPLVGIFAQRAKARPNRIGITTCELVSVEGLVVTVRGLDAIDGSPVLDIKPHVREFGPRTAVEQPEWIGELMQEYWRIPHDE